MFKIDKAVLLVTQSAAEKEWRNVQLSSADIVINKLFDAGASTVEWSTYRSLLRDWPAHKQYPQFKYRPIAPQV